MRRPSPPWILLALATAALAAPRAEAQLLGGGGLGLPAMGGLPAGPGLPVPQASAPSARTDLRPKLGELTRPATTAAGSALGQTLRAASDLGRALTVEPLGVQAGRLLKAHPEAVEPDERGQPVVRGQVLALAPEPGALARLRQAGFRVQSTDRLEPLGLTTVVLQAPPGIGAVEARRRLQALDPGGAYELNHIYFESGGIGGPAAAPGARPVAEARGLRLGLVDGTVAAGHPAFRGARLTQKAFAPGGAQVSAHATAVASLLVGSQAAFRGGAPGAALLVADVYGPTAAGGSAEALARGLAWLAAERTPVITISLVGPSNLVLQAAVKALVARGHLLVAAVGNDGPAAPPLYPAAFPGVVGVTAVDARRNVLPEAGRGPQVGFAAPGAQMAAAGANGGYAVVRGTSFAAPLAAAELARLLPAPDPSAANRAMAALATSAADLGAPGPDPVFGRGLVAFDRRTDPAAVGARAVALRGP